MRDLESLFEKKETYRDFDIRFIKNPVNNDVVTLSTVDSIKQSIRLLVQTSFHDHPMYPRIGTRIRASLFELFHTGVTDGIKQEIINVIGTFEPRVVLKSVTVDTSPYILDANELRVHIEYIIYGGVQRVAQVITLQRVR